jgi:hypothetical protein
MGEVGGAAAQLGGVEGRRKCGAGGVTEACNDAYVLGLCLARKPGTALQVSKKALHVV